MKPKRMFEPHLVIKDLSLPPSGEWKPELQGCSVAQVRKGIGYWQQPNLVQELGPGSLLVFSGDADGLIRASQLSEANVSYCCMDLERLTGLLSLGEQNALREAVSLEKSKVRLIPPNDQLAQRFQNLCQPSNKQRGRSLLRLHLIELFMDLFRCELDEGEMGEDNGELDGRARLRQFLKETAASELLQLSLSDLAPQMHCSQRHLSRLFRQEVGMSFREKQTELRLANACQLLLTSKAKLTVVALASGYQSNSLFNLTFKKQFGMSPGEWRERQLKKPPQRQKIMRMLPV
jgi:AraC-like DNA-binding protein